jgi:hypothetical protein
MDHVTIWHSVQRHEPELHRRCRPELRITNRSWRVDETDIGASGKRTRSGGAMLTLPDASFRRRCAHPLTLGREGTMWAETRPIQMLFMSSSAAESLAAACQCRPVRYRNNTTSFATLICSFATLPVRQPRNRLGCVTC